MTRNLTPVWLVLAHWCFAAAALAGPADKRLDIYWIDVEGGAATLLVTPAGETVLIDSGNPQRRDADRVLKMVGDAGMKQIDHLIITHYHGDHFGGATLLASLIPIRNLYDNGQFDNMPDNPGKAYFDLKADAKHVVKPGDLLPLKQLEESSASQLSLRFLGGKQKFIDPPADAADNATVCAASRAKERDGSDNANSLVMVVTFGGWRFFDAGDLTWNQEARLVCPKNLVGQVDVYQVTHHGLDSSNNPLVLQTLEPRVAIMNNGMRKGCLPEVFANLKETKSLEAIYQVHKNLRDDGAANNVADDYIANKEPESACKGNYIKLSVAPDGKSYTVSIPTNGHERIFETR
ncbi:MAG: MBL fold metallo-hydrolase [Planctomycetaceae bacterium]|nr:MBL fold metallo-hydrolase [Planctomycetaceae bacterium]